MKKIIQATSAAVGLAAIAGLSACSTTANTNNATSHKSHPPYSAPASPSASPSASSNDSGSMTLLNVGQTVDWTYTYDGQVSHYKVTLYSAKDEGRDSTQSRYNVLHLQMKVVNTGTNSAEADLLPTMEWVGESGKVDDTIGGLAAGNDTTTFHDDNGTDLSLQSQLEPGQSEVGYMDVDVPNNEKGVIAIPSTDSDYQPIKSGTLILNVDGLSHQQLYGGF